MSRRLPLLAIALFLLAGVSPLAAQQAKIEAIDSFGPPTGTSGGYSVTDSGVVVGGSNRGGGTAHPMRWTSAGGTQNLMDPASVVSGIAYSVSADGASIVGIFSDSNGRRAFRWTQTGGIDAGLAPHEGFTQLELAQGVSADGSIVVGTGYRSLYSHLHPRHAYRWTAQGIQDLGTLNDPIRQSEAYAVSADGSVVVGKSQLVIPQGQGLFLAWRAFRWTQADGMQNLGYLDNSLNPDPLRYASEANAVSADGSTVVGRSQVTQNGLGTAFVHTLGDGIQALPILNEDGNDQSNAYGVSGDGRIIVGVAPTLEKPNGEGCIWIDGNVRSLRDFLENECGLDTSAWTTISHGTAVSPDGTRILGSGLKANNGTAFCVTLRPDFQPPTIETDVEEGESFVANVGSTFEATFLGTDPDGEGLTVTATGLPEGAELTPTAGTTSSSPLSVELRWTPGASDFGSSHEITITFDDAYADGKVSRSFELVVPENQTPTVAPLDPVTLECVEGGHRVTLETTVDDADGDPLTVTWKIDGEVVKTESAEPNAAIAFAEDYDHGTHEVVVEVSDGFDLATAGTTITVKDTKAPILFVAADVVVGTDSGEDFASNVVLIPPTATDASGHEISLESDEQWSYPVGETIVTWTARDEDGNVATGQQKVFVEDREKPLIGGAAIVRFNVDYGRTFSTQRPPEPAVSDNVSDVSSIRVISDAPARFPIGRTRVTFTAIDDGGNEANFKMDVLVANRRPQAKAGRNVGIVTTTDRGVKVALDGSASSDVDGQRLKFAWSAPGIKLGGATGPKPVGRFPIGTTTVTLTVTDTAGKSDTDTVDVKVRLRPAPPPRRQMASEAFARAAEQATTGLSPRGSTNGNALAGLAYAGIAARLASREAMTSPDDSPDPGLALFGAEASVLQQSYGAAAASALLSAYAETGDESLLSAYGYAAYGAAYAASDTSDP